MKISSRIDYALSCVLRVAENYSHREPLTVKKIALREGLEPDYVEKLLFILKKSGIAKSVRGVAGGYILTKPAEDISILDVFKAFDKNILELACLRKKGREGKCVHVADCRIRNFWIGLRLQTESYLKSFSLKDLLALRRKEKSWRKKD